MEEKSNLYIVAIVGVVAVVAMVVLTVGVTISGTEDAAGQVAASPWLDDGSDTGRVNCYLCIDACIRGIPEGQDQNDCVRNDCLRDTCGYDV